MVKVAWDVQAGNALGKEGGSGIDRGVDSFRAEAGGKRGGILIVNLDDPSQIPAVAEPWFVACNATVEFLPVMLPEDLKKAGAAIEAAVRKYR
jgi:hypothetical protein